MTPDPLAEFWKTDAAFAVSKFNARWNNLKADPSITADLDEWETEFP